MTNLADLFNFYSRGVHSDKKISLKQKVIALTALFDTFTEISTQKEAHDIVRNLTSMLRLQVDFYQKSLELLISKLKPNVYLKNTIIIYILKNCQFTNFNWLCLNIEKGFVLTKEIFQSIVTNKNAKAYTLIKNPLCSKTLSYMDLFENKKFLTNIIPFYCIETSLKYEYDYNHHNPNHNLETYRKNMEYIISYFSLTDQDRMNIFNHFVKMIDSIDSSESPIYNIYNIIHSFIDYFKSYDVVYTNKFIGYFYYLDHQNKKYNIPNKNIILKNSTPINLYEISLRLSNYRTPQNSTLLPSIFNAIYKDYKCTTLDDTMYIDLIEFIGIELFCKVYKGAYDTGLLGKLILKNIYITKENFIDSYIASGGTLSKPIYNLICSMKKIDLLELFFQNKFIPNESDIELIQLSIQSEFSLIQKFLVLFNTYSVYFTEKTIIHICNLLYIRAECTIENISMFKIIMPYTIYHDDEGKFYKMITSYVVPRIKLLCTPRNTLYGMLYGIIPIDPLLYSLTKSEINYAPFNGPEIITSIIEQRAQNLTSVANTLSTTLSNRTDITFKKIVKK